MHYQIIVLNINAKIDKLYVYETSEQLIQGEIVKIPYGANQKRLGIVYQETEHSFVFDVLKEIERFTNPTVVKLESAQINLIEYLVKQHNFGYFQALKKVIDLNNYKINYRNNVFEAKQKFQYQENRKVVFKKNYSNKEWLQKRATNQIEKHHFTSSKIIIENAIVKLTNNEEIETNFEYIIKNFLKISKITYCPYAINYEKKLINILEVLKLLKTLNPSLKIIKETKTFQAKITILGDFKKLETIRKYDIDLIVIKNYFLKENLIDFSTKWESIYKELLKYKIITSENFCAEYKCFSIVEPKCNLLLIGEYSKIQIGYIASHLKSTNVYIIGKIIDNINFQAVVSYPKEEISFIETSNLVGIIKNRGYEAMFYSGYLTEFKKRKVFMINTKMEKNELNKLLLDYQEQIKSKIYIY